MSVLYLWQHLPADKDAFKQQEENRVLENVERVHMGVHPNASFSSVVSGALPPQTILHTPQLLARIAELAAPEASITIVQAVTVAGGAGGKLLVSREDLVKQMKLSGMTNVEEPKEFKTDFKEEIRKTLSLEGEFDVVEVRCTMPNFEIGSSRLLSFAKKASVAKPSAEASKVWNIADLEDDDIDLVDSDELLDEEDLVKPDPASLRVCGTTGKRKACKDCSCGLKEELDAGKKPQKKDVTSSCGSCYLGDAFRCASCPYLGMPAFKPGEKVQLSDRQLKADV